MATGNPEQATRSVYEAIGGRETVQRIVSIFYDLVEKDPRYAELRALHGPDLTETRKSLEGYLAGWFGGPRDWFEQNPGRCIMSVHSGIRITHTAAQQWVEAMSAAVRQSGIDTGLGVRLSVGMARVAAAMVVREE